MTLDFSIWGGKSGMGEEMKTETIDTSLGRGDGVGMGEQAGKPVPHQSASPFIFQAV